MFEEILKYSTIHEENKKEIGSQLVWHAVNQIQNTD